MKPLKIIFYTMNKTNSLSHLQQIITGTVSHFFLLLITQQGYAATKNETTVIYKPAYFTQYSPVTLKDMIKKIPGGTAIIRDLKDNNEERGFGANGSPLLINGKRMSGKSNNIKKKLTLIQASQVDQIQLIRGTAEGLDIRSEGIIINVLTKENQQASSTFLSFKGYAANDAGALPEFFVSYNSSYNNLTYGISYEYDTWLSFIHNDEKIFTANKTISSKRVNTTDKKDKSHIITGNIDYSFSNGDTIRLNGLYTLNKWRVNFLEDQLNFVNTTTAPSSLTEIQTTINDNDNWEIGGDYAKDINNLGALKVLFVVNRKTHDDIFSLYNLTNNEVSNLFIFSNSLMESEKIIRSSLTSTIKGHTLEYGVEGAFNTLDKTVAFDNLFPENTVIEEKRYDVFVTHSMALNRKINLQTALTNEISTISQHSLNISNSRRFNFLKPRIEARYNVTQQDQFRILLEHTVSQLDLNDFVASRDTENNSIYFGNTDLTQEKTWIYRLSYEKRFEDDTGSIELELGYDRISDHIDKITIEKNGKISSGIGNIDNASKIKANIESNIRLGFIHLPTAVLTIKYNFNDTETTDPFTNEKRPISDIATHYWSIDFQHDIIDWDFTYGFSMDKSSPKDQQDIYLHETKTQNPYMSLFAEYKLQKNMTLYFDLKNVFNEKHTINKIYYDGHVINAIVDRFEMQHQRVNRLAIIALKMNF